MHGKSVNFSKEWKNYQVKSAGHSKTSQQTSLRKEMNFNSKCLRVYEENQEQFKLNPISNFVKTLNKKYLQSIFKIFNTVDS